jgi:hypothetical protein
MSKIPDGWTEVPVLSADDMAAFFDKKDAQVIQASKQTPQSTEKKQRGRPKGQKNATPITRALAQEQAAVRSTTNARTLATRDAYNNIVQKYGDPLEELAKVAFEREADDDGREYYVNPVETRLTALKELVGYGHSKLKTVEHTGANGEPLEFKMTMIQNILQMMTGKDEAAEPRTVIDAE